MAGKAEPPQQSCTKSQRLEQIKTFVVDNWLPIVFAVAITIALAWPVPGKAVVSQTVLGNVHIVQEVTMGVVFFISGLTLNTQDLKKAKGHWWGVVFGFTSILMVTPALGAVMRSIPLEPSLFSLGLMIFCIVPTTLGVGVAMVRACKGNEGIALMMTVGTNMLGVFTMPLWLKLLTINYDLTNLNISVNIGDLLAKLSITILAPSVIGKLLREYVKPVEEFAKKWRSELSMTSTACLAFIIWQTLSAARERLFDSQAEAIVLIIVLAAFIYCFYLTVHWLVIWFLFRMPMPEAVSVIIISSQKSAPVAITLISYITSDTAVQGLLATPIIVAQLMQIFIGSAMSPPIAKRMGDYQKEQKRIQAEVQAAGGEAGGAAAVPAGSVDIIQAEVAVSIEAGTTAVTGAETQSGEQQQHQHAEGTHEAETLVQVLVHEQVDGDPAAGSEPMSR